MRRWVRDFVEGLRSLSNSGRFIIALTGTIGSGKTTVLNLFRDFGFFVISSDEIVKRLLTSEPYCSIILARYPQVGDSFHKIDRKLLARLIFSDERAKRFVEDIIHPKVALSIVERIKKASSKRVVVEVPLLFEVGLEKGFDLTICVVAEDRKVIKRLEKRGLELADINARISKQLSSTMKVNLSDIVIVNNEDINSLREKVYSVSLALGVI